MSNKTMQLPPLLSSAANQECEKTVGESPIAQRDRNPYGQSPSKPSRSRNGHNWSKMPVSKTFKIVGARVIRRELLASEEFLNRKTVSFFYCEDENFN